MAKSRVTAEQEMRQLNVKVSQEDSEFIQEILRLQLGVPYNADAVREVISRLRTWFHVPRHVFAALQQDSETHELHIIGYLQMLLHRRYESLAQASALPSHQSIESEN